MGAVTTFDYDEDWVSRLIWIMIRYGWYYQVWLIMPLWIKNSCLIHLAFGCLDMTDDNLLGGLDDPLKNEIGVVDMFILLQTKSGWLGLLLHWCNGCRLPYDTISVLGG